MAYAIKGRRRMGLRGLGAALPALGVMQTVTDPTTGQKVQIPTTTTEVDITPSGSSQFFDLTSGAPVYLGAGVQTVGDWITGNSSTLLIGAAVFFVGMFALGAMRR